MLGILKLENDYILIIGIQSEVTTLEVTGQIEFVPIKYFDDIINEDKDKLQPLFPPYMNAFKYLLTEIFKLEEAINPNLQQKISSVFLEQIKSIELEPYDIYKSDIGYKLLGDNFEKPYSKELWTAWIEYLLILSLIESKNIDISVIEETFKNKRLIHSNKNLSWLEIIPDILNDIKELNDKAIIIISTKKVPLGKKRFQNNVIQNIFSARNVNTVQIDQGEIINSIKELIHIKAFEIDCILKNETEFDHIPIQNIKDIIKELKSKLNDFFEN